MNILIYLACGLLGTLFITLTKMQSVKKDFAVANKHFVLSKFFEDEATGILMAVVSIVIVAVTLPEWSAIKPGTEKYVRTIFVLAGGSGSWALQYLFGKSKKYIRNVIDIKTDIADNKTSEI